MHKQKAAAAQAAAARGPAAAHASELGAALKAADEVATRGGAAARGAAAAQKQKAAAAQAAQAGGAAARARPRPMPAVADLLTPASMSTSLPATSASFWRLPGLGFEAPAAPAATPAGASFPFLLRPPRRRCRGIRGSCNNRYVLYWNVLVGVCSGAWRGF